jgi:hypothetical protein
MKYSILVLSLVFLFTFCKKDRPPASDPPVVNPPLSGENNILSFRATVAGIAITGTIQDTLITASTPNGTSGGLRTLKPSITISPNATISPDTSLTQDFTQPVIYTVKAANGKEKKYKVTITVIAPTVLDNNHLPDTLKDIAPGIDYIVQSGLTLAGIHKMLVVDPGVTIQFDSATGIYIHNGAALKMIGTSAKPITLQGKNLRRGDWAGVQIHSNNTENQWEYVTLRDAGGAGAPGGVKAGLAIMDDTSLMEDTHLSIKHCKVLGNLNWGILDVPGLYNYERTVFTAFENNELADNVKAMSLNIELVEKIDATNNIYNNGQNAITIGGNVNREVTLKPLTGNYQIDETVFLRNRLNVLPGVMIWCSGHALITTTGDVSGLGSFVANGTADKHIWLRGLDDQGHTAGPGWQGLILDNDNPDILLNYCDFSRSGFTVIDPGSPSCPGKVMAVINFAPTCSRFTSKCIVTNCSIIGNGMAYGIVYKNGSTIDFSNTTFNHSVLQNTLSY